MSNQYQLANHTILPLIYRIIHPQTKSLCTHINFQFSIFNKRATDQIIAIVCPSQK
jgi:hypothetical protein